MLGWEDVRRVALGLPGVEETTTYGQPCFKVNGRPFVNTGRVEGAVVTRAVDEDELAGRIEDSFAFIESKPPKRRR